MLNFAAATLLQNLEYYHWSYPGAWRYDHYAAIGALDRPVLHLVPGDDLRGLVPYSPPPEPDPQAGIEVHVVPSAPGQLHMRYPEFFAEKIADFALRVVPDLAM